MIFFLYNIKAETIMPGLIQEAKDRLLIEATNFLEKTKHHYVYDISTHSIESSEKEIEKSGRELFFPVRQRGLWNPGFNPIPKILITDSMLHIKLGRILNIQD